jgi:hypothetical protein
MVGDVDAHPTFEEMSFVGQKQSMPINTSWSQAK